MVYKGVESEMSHSSAGMMVSDQGYESKWPVFGVEGITLDTYKNSQAHYIPSRSTSYPFQDIPGFLMNNKNPTSVAGESIEGNIFTGQLQPSSQYFTPSGTNGISQHSTEPSQRNDELLFRKIDLPAFTNAQPSPLHSARKPLTFKEFQPSLLWDQNFFGYEHMVNQPLSNQRCLPGGRRVVDVHAKSPAPHGATNPLLILGSGSALLARDPNQPFSHIGDMNQTGRTEGGNDTVMAVAFSSSMIVPYFSPVNNIWRCDLQNPHADCIDPSFDEWKEGKKAPLFPKEILFNVFSV